MKKSSLTDLVLAVTYRCNSRCQMCNIWQITEHNEFSAKSLLNLPASLRDINITGGEPFLRLDLFDLIKNIKIASPRSRLIISTNGFATDLIIEQVKKILPIMPGLGIAISIDGLAAKHDEIRGIPGGFGQAMNTIKKLKLLGIKNLKLSFTMGDYNYLELPKVYSLAKELGTEFTIAVVHSSDNYFGKENKIENKNHLITQLDWLIKQELAGLKPKNWGRAYFAYGLKQLLLTSKRILPDYSGQKNIFIDPTGNVYPCDVSSTQIGELKNINKLAEQPVCLEPSNSWMMCTARPAIRKHILKGMLWVLQNKF